MLPTQRGGFRLFRLAGIDVFLHWSWFVVALFEIQRARDYSSPVWNVLEYLALFVIVLLRFVPCVLYKYGRGCSVSLMSYAPVNTVISFVPV